MEKIFKAKRIDNGKWKEFGLFDIGTSASGDFWVADKKTGSVFNVDKKTISQYTGIDDSEGNRIFEGDEVKGYKNKPNKPYIVRYHASKYSCGFVASDNEECNPHINIWYEGLTLTGRNIHDKG
jgi:uncharacterized phage protein (TIGR01671 family)